MIKMFLWPFSLALLQSSMFRCPPLWGGEAIVRDGDIVGGVRRADHSFKCGSPLAAGYVAHARTHAQTARLFFQVCLGCVLLNG